MFEPVYAVADGKVTFAGAAGTAGNMVIIEHSAILDFELWFDDVAHDPASFFQMRLSV